MAVTVGITEVPIPKLVQNADKRDTVSAAANGHDSILEPKLDGWRVVWKVEDDGEGGKRVRSFTRSGTDLTGKMPAIEAEFARELPAGTILDSEVTAFKVKDGRIVQSSSNVVGSILSSGVAKAAAQSGVLQAVVFDLIAHGGHDARTLPYAKRRELLEALFDQHEFAKRVQLIPQLEATDANYDALIAAGYEGGMVKWTTTPYQSHKRGAGWWKIKGEATVDAIVIGYKPGTPGSSFDGYIGAVEFGQYDSETGLLVPRGRTSGMDWDVRVDITNHQDEYIGRVFELTHNGVQKPENGSAARFRHPRFIRWRPDKAAEEVTTHDA